MAMINCPECNESISDRAHTCPSCGYPIEIYIQKLREAEKRRKSLEEAKRLEIEKEIRGEFDDKVRHLKETTEAERTALKNEIISLTNQNSALQSQLEEVKRNNEDLVKQVEAAVQKGTQNGEEIAAYKSQIEQASEASRKQIEEISVSLRSSENENEHLRKEVEEISVSLKTSENENEHLHKEVEEISVSLRSSENENERLHKEVEQLKSENRGLLSEVQGLKAEAEGLKARGVEQSEKAISEISSSYEEKMTQLRESAVKEKDALEKELTITHSKNSDLVKQIETLSEENEAKDRLIASLKESSQTSESEKSELEKEWVELKRERAELEERESALEEKKRVFLKEQEASLGKRNSSDDISRTGQSEKNETSDKIQSKHIFWGIIVFLCVLVVCIAIVLIVAIGKEKDSSSNTVSEAVVLETSTANSTATISNEDKPVSENEKGETVGKADTSTSDNTKSLNESELQKEGEETYEFILGESKAINPDDYTIIDFSTTYTEKELEKICKSCCKFSGDFLSVNLRGKEISALKQILEKMYTPDSGARFCATWIYVDEPYYLLAPEIINIRNDYLMDLFIVVDEKESGYFEWATIEGPEVDEYFYPFVEFSQDTTKDYPCVIAKTNIPEEYDSRIRQLQIERMYIDGKTVEPMDYFTDEIRLITLYHIVDGKLTDKIYSSEYGPYADGSRICFQNPKPSSSFVMFVNKKE